jgi:hypothetical protein
LVEFEVIRGGSGRWIAREVLSRYSNGRVETYGQVFVGHVPARVERPEMDEVIARQIKRGGVPGIVPPGGGMEFTIMVDMEDGVEDQA